MIMKEIMILKMRIMRNFEKYRFIKKNKNIENINLLIFKI